MALNIVAQSKNNGIPLALIAKKEFAAWLKKQSPFIRNWLAVNHMTGEPGQCCLLPTKDGKLERAIACISDMPDLWSIANLATALPANRYDIETPLKADLATQLALGWALAGYRFTRYKKNDKPLATLVLPKNADMKYVMSMAESVCWARDLINTPAGDMHPRALANEAAQFAKTFSGKATVISGKELLKANYPTVYTVGKAAEVPPHFVDLRFARKGAPKVTLVGKGVTFDSGGLDIKPSGNMKLMKKDMGGAACVLALARAIVETGLKVDLRVLLPIVENAVAGNAMRPLDIVKTRKGITVEIGNTDAEGRLILCDALTEADSEKPDLIIDCSTLTGAARVALGTEVPAFFTPDSKLAAQVMKYSAQENDPLWQLPLWKNYRSQLDSKVADISNDPESGYGGAITAALYLKEFVEHTTSWLHIDMMAWNNSAKPGRPAGGEAMAVRALYALIKENYSS